MKISQVLLSLSMAPKNQKRNKEKKFLDLPKYPGGSKAFKRFISDNLLYPEEALEHRVEGDVYIQFKVDNLGNVIDATVTKGLGYGCDEEAIRLVKLLKYERAVNRGLRVSSTVKTRIRFRINKKQVPLKISYETPVKKKKPAEHAENNGKKKINYTITIKRS